MLKIWFMYDNHTFAKVEPSDRDGLIRRAKELFAKDGYGGLFVRDEFDSTMQDFNLHGRGKGDPSAKKIGEWADKILAEVSFRHRMHA